MDDLLNHDERLRLEALAQAVARSATRADRTPEDIVGVARAFESYIRGLAATDNTMSAHGEVSVTFELADRRPEDLP